MRTTRERSIRVLGVEIARVEETVEVEWAISKERGSFARSRPEPLAIDQDYLTPLITDSLKNLPGELREKVGFLSIFNGIPLEVPGNIDSDSSCMYLRDKVKGLTKDKTVDILMGFAAQTDIWDREDRGFAAILRSEFRRTVNEHWENDTS